MDSEKQRLQYEFQLKLDTIKSLSFYRIDDTGNKRIDFDSKVYIVRYATVNAILAMPQWLDQVKKVLSPSKFHRLRATRHLPLFSLN